MRLIRSNTRLDGPRTFSKTSGQLVIKRSVQNSAYRLLIRVNGYAIMEPSPSTRRHGNFSNDPWNSFNAFERICRFRAIVWQSSSNGVPGAGPLSCWKTIEPKSWSRRRPDKAEFPFPAWISWPGCSKLVPGHGTTPNGCDFAELFVKPEQNLPTRRRAGCVPLFHDFANVYFHLTLRGLFLASVAEFQCDPAGRLGRRNFRTRNYRGNSQSSQGSLTYLFAIFNFTVLEVIRGTLYSTMFDPVFRRVRVHGRFVIGIDWRSAILAAWNLFVIRGRRIPSIADKV